MYWVIVKEGIRNSSTGENSYFLAYAKATYKIVYWHRLALTFHFYIICNRVLFQKEHIANSDSQTSENADWLGLCINQLLSYMLSTVKAHMSCEKVKLCYDLGLNVAKSFSKFQQKSQQCEIKPIF